ncbi:hypothetical protein KCP74_02865 [Salmonella enterica subsp. enterica]|nr:hypothetical protein KCP74_02865 [Salmonella enterica subsp. enterica]
MKTLFGVSRLGLLVSVLAILVSFCLRPGYMATLMTHGSDAALYSGFAERYCWRRALVRGDGLRARLKSKTLRCWP